MSICWLIPLMIAATDPPAANTDDARPVVTIASKAFTESVILGEMVSHLVQGAGGTPIHKRRLGGTRIAFEALVSGGVDIYPEYTGTISEEILAGQGIHGEEAIRRMLAERGIRMSRPLGFNNTYIMGMKEEAAERRGIRTISDLRRFPDLKLGFSNEFMDRGDGWPSLRDRYGLPHQSVRGLQHDLAYRGLENDGIDVIDLYATDAEIRYYNLRPLKDDLGHFPAYHAVLLYRADLRERAPDVVAAVLRLEGRISQEEMIALNARAKLERIPETQVAAHFLTEALGERVHARIEGLGERLARHTVEHLYLVGISLSAAIALAIPLGIFAVRSTKLGQVVLGVTGIIQTIPSLALLVFMIPFFGIGAPPAIVALFLYSLLPIVRNTYTGLHDIPAALLESADALGLPPRVRLRRVELPMASRSILAGIKTSAVINVGTATLGGFIAAGGYGQLIFSGITRDDMGLILQGAIPAALLALLVQGLFDLADRVLVPKGLRLKTET